VIKIDFSGFSFDSLRRWWWWSRKIRGKISKSFSQWKCVH